MHLQFLKLISFSIFSLILFTQCSSSDPEPADCGTTGPSVTINSVVDASCGQDNGEVTLAITGGSGLEFSIAGAAFQSIAAGTATVTDIPSGSLVITVRDANSCTTTGSFTVDDINTLAIDLDNEDSGCQTSNGSITVTASGGTTPYSYSIDGGAAQSDNSFTGLASGDYTVLVTDDEGCETSTTLSVLSGVSYAAEIVPIIDVNCAISSCHDGNTTGLLDWSVLANVQENASNIKTRTANMSMPLASSGLTLEQSEIDAIGCWVDDGALDN